MGRLIGQWPAAISHVAAFFDARQMGDMELVQACLLSLHSPLEVIGHGVVWGLGGAICAL